MGLALSNKYLKVIIECQKPMIFDHKVELSFGYYRKEPLISILNSEVLNILWRLFIL